MYDAAGTKLRKVVKDNGVTVYTQDYAGGIEYRSGKLEAIYHAEGRVYNTNVTTTNPALALSYLYTIKDHLGNARLSFTDKDGDSVVEVLTGGANEVIQVEPRPPAGAKSRTP